jgi:hypothetical protein
MPCADLGIPVSVARVGVHLPGPRCLCGGKQFGPRPVHGANKPPQRMAASEADRPEAGFDRACPQREDVPLAGSFELVVKIRYKPMSARVASSI